jgi:hypothetical protein
MNNKMKNIDEQRVVLSELIKNITYFTILNADNDKQVSRKWRKIFEHLAM